MGILNATPDSFYTRSLDSTLKGLLNRAEQMLQEGARILDVGGMSSRPGAPAVPVDEELSRILPVISAIRSAFPEALISVDTYRARVAEAAVMAGAGMVNDISAGSMDPGMIPTVAGLRVPYIAMHMKGTPADMQQNPVYEDVVAEISDYFIQKTGECTAAGITDIIIDPGFGFGKTQEHNFKLLKGMHVLAALQKPVLAGVSRKSMLYRMLGTTAEAALNATTAVHMLALQQGASLLRVHDVREAVECIRLFSYYQTV